MTEPDTPQRSTPEQSIPDQLRSETPTFLKLAPGSKAPARGNSEKKGPFYRASDAELAAHLAGGGNVGRVLRDDLIAVDVDHPDLLEYLDLPETFAVESGGDGFSQHRYYRCPGFDGKQIELTEGDENLGSVRSGNCYCLVPPSVHDETGDPYAVHAARPVAAVSDDEVWSLISEFGGETIAIENAGAETIDGVETYIIAITHADESVDAEVRLWFEPVSSMVVRQRASMENGTVTVDATATDFEVGDDADPRTTEDGLSDVTTVRSVEELREAAPFPVARLSGDADYNFERGGVARFGPGATVTSLYASGSAMTVVTRTDVDVLPGEVTDAPAETVDLGGRPVEVATTDDGHVAWWRSGEITTAVVSDRSREDLLSFVEGLVVE